MSSPYERRKAKGPNHGRVSEKNTMKQLGARLTPGSGAMAGCKSDGYDEKFRYENKATIHDSFSLKKSVLRKIEEEAMATGRNPALCISFTTASGVSVPGGDFVVISRDVFQALIAGDLI